MLLCQHFFYKFIVNFYKVVRFSNWFFYKIPITFIASVFTIHFHADLFTLFNGVIFKSKHDQDSMCGFHKHQLIMECPLLIKHFFLNLSPTINLSTTLRLSLISLSHSMPSRIISFGCLLALGSII